VCVCVCVCERKGEREEGGGGDWDFAAWAQSVGIGYNKKCDRQTRREQEEGQTHRAEDSWKNGGRGRWGGMKVHTELNLRQAGSAASCGGGGGGGGHQQFSPS
jgi:hypothetical protein